MSAQQKTCRFYDRIVELMQETPIPGNPAMKEDVLDKLAKMENPRQTILKWAESIPTRRDLDAVRKNPDLSKEEIKHRKEELKRLHRQSLYVTNVLWKVLTQNYDEKAMTFGSKRHIALNEGRIAAFSVMVRHSSERTAKYLRYLLQHGIPFYRAQAVRIYLTGHHR